MIKSKRLLIYFLCCCCFVLYIIRLYYLGVIVTTLSPGIISSSSSSNINKANLSLMTVSSTTKTANALNDMVILSVDHRLRIKSEASSSEVVPLTQHVITSSENVAVAATENKPIAMKEVQYHKIMMGLEDDKNENGIRKKKDKSQGSMRGSNLHKDPNVLDIPILEERSKSKSKIKSINSNIKTKEKNDIAELNRRTIKPMVSIPSSKIEYSLGLSTEEIGPLCSSELGMKKYRCDSPNEYCNMTLCKHTSVFQLKPGVSEIDVTDFKDSFDHIHRYFAGMEERLLLLQKKMDDYHKMKNIKKHSRPLFIMFVNFGYVYQFLNWLCGCEKHGITNIKDEIMVLTTDPMAEDMLRKLNIYTIHVNEFGSWMRNAHYEVGPSRKFGLGIHAKINLQSIALLADLIQLGYDAFVMDADLVWRQDPRPEMIKTAKDKKYDGLFLSDGRTWDYIIVNKTVILDQFRPRSDFDHPYMTHNTGFFLIRSSAVMKEFMSSLMRGLHLILWKGTDQMWWNTLIFHKRFSHLNFGVLPDNRFIPGSRISTAGNVKGPTGPFPTDSYVVAHMSDTSAHLKKITKFYKTGQWFLTEQCSYYNVCMNFTAAYENSIYGCLPTNYKDFYFTNATV